MSTREAIALEANGLYIMEDSRLLHHQTDLYMVSMVKVIKTKNLRIPIFLLSKEEVP